MLLEIPAQSFAQHAHAAAVDDAHTRQAGEKSAIEKFFYAASGVVHVFADDIDLAGRGGIFGDSHLNAAGARCFYRRGTGASENFGDVSTGNTHGHFAAAQFDLEIVVIKAATDERGAAQ